jgi:UDP-glucose 4-epimerase
LKKILVTGTSGFIGSQLLAKLCKVYGSDNIIALSSRSCDICETVVYTENQFHLTEVQSELVKSAEVLIHAGAFTPKNAKATNDILRSNSNINYTARLLQLPLDNLSKIIYLSTIDVYAAEVIISEETPTHPSSLYGWSKLYCEQMITAYANERDLTNLILRIGHVYGPGEEKYEKFIPNAINSIQRIGSVELWGSGEDLRSFIYIDDVIVAIINSINADTDLRVINVVGSSPISIYEILQLLIKISGKEVSILQKDSNGHRRDYIFDASKLHQYLLEKETELSIGLKFEYDYLWELK